MGRGGRKGTGEEEREEKRIAKAICNDMCGREQHLGRENITIEGR